MPTLLLVLLRMALSWLGVFALLVSAGPARAQSMYRCVDNGGQVHIGQGRPPAWCREDTTPVPVPKALLDRPVSEKEVEEVKEYLNQKLVDLAGLKEKCAAQHSRIDELKDDSLDALDERADNRRSGRVSRAESRAAKSIEESAEKAKGSALKCVQDANQRIAEVNAILRSPEKLRAEVPALRAALARERELAEARRRAAAREALAQERAGEERRLAQERAAAQLSDELGQQLRVLLENARGASEILTTGSYNAFAVRVQTVRQQAESISVKYAVQLRNGDHKNLGMTVSAACAAIFAADADWRKERRAANDLASAKEAVNAANRIGGSTQAQREGFEAAQRQYEQAQTRLAASKESATRLMAQAMKPARNDEEQRLRARAPRQ